MAVVSLGKTSLTGMAGGHHWAVQVGNTWYEYIGTAPQMRSKCDIKTKRGDRSAEGAGGSGRVFTVGSTAKDDFDVTLFVDRYERAHPEYCSLSINCQKFAVEFIDWLTDGNYDIHLMHSAGLGVRRSFATAFSASNGEESRATYRLGHLAAEGLVFSGKAEGPSVNVQHSKRKGGFIDVEVCRLEASVGGTLGAAFCPNLNTGAGMRHGNVEGRLLGLGGCVGQNGITLSTPLFELKLNAFGCLCGGAQGIAKLADDTAGCFMGVLVNNTALFDQEFVGA